MDNDIHPRHWKADQNMAIYTPKVDLFKRKNDNSEKIY